MAVFSDTKLSVDCYPEGEHTSVQGTEAGAGGVKAECGDFGTGAFLSDKQQSHALQRLGTLVAEQRREYGTANPLPFTYRPGVSLDAKVTMIKDGSAKLIDLGKKTKAIQLPSGEHTLWEAMFTFPPTAEQKTWDEVDSKRRAFWKALDIKHQAAIDRIILGTNVTALTILSGFGEGAPDPTKPVPSRK